MKRTAARTWLCIPVAIVAATGLLIPTATAATPAGEASSGGTIEGSRQAAIDLSSGQSAAPAVRPDGHCNGRFDDLARCDWETLVDIAQADSCEAARYEAVMAIGRRLNYEPECRAALVCRPCARRGLLRRTLSRLFGIERRSVQYVYVLNDRAANASGEPACCNREMQEALSNIATGVSRDGQPLEPSPRVRQAAVAVLAVCERIGVCDEDGLPPRPKGTPGHNPVPSESFEIEEPPPGSAGFEPLALSRSLDALTH